MATIYTVSQLNNEIKDLLDAVPGYRGLMVQGEISNYKAHSSGHHYMTLKDENAAINAVMFRSDAMRLKFRLQNGMKVIVKARVSSFPRTGAVQLYVSEIIPDGAGALNLAFEQLKAKLQAEGLFSERYKKPIPSCPDSIALVTSPTGAAVRDMIRILGRRWPRLCSIRRRCRDRARRRALHARSLWRMPSAKQMSFCAAEAAARWRICGRSMRK